MVLKPETVPEEAYTVIGTIFGDNLPRTVEFRTEKGKEWVELVRKAVINLGCDSVRAVASEGIPAEALATLDDGNAGMQNNNALWVKCEFMKGQEALGSVFVLAVVHSGSDRTRVKILMIYPTEVD